jgi:hypothetical protein
MDMDGVLLSRRMPITSVHHRRNSSLMTHKTVGLGATLEGRRRPAMPMDTKTIRHRREASRPAPTPEEVVAAASVLWREEVLRLAKAQQLSRKAFEAMGTLTDAALDCAYAAVAERRAQPPPTPADYEHRARLRIAAHCGYAHGR